ncbi:GntR family transcriptional regulator [Breoghania sp. L-A4]|nr:GntR family transcriptional regulator [Breoghania sp. L-A4]
MSGRMADRLRDQLEQEIVTGVHAPGARLDEVKLAERFKVSRTPIREAFQQLSASGLLELKPRRGAFVRSAGINEIIEMFEVMAELEGMCGRLTARRISSEDLAALREAMEACESAFEGGDADAYYYENERFHHVIYRACGNSFLTGQAMTLHRRLKPYRRLQLRVRGRMRQSLVEHRQVVEAIAAEDAEAAQRALTDHVIIQGGGFNDLVAGLERQAKLRAAS